MSARRVRTYSNRVSFDATVLRSVPDSRVLVKGHGFVNCIRRIRQLHPTVYPMVGFGVGTGTYTTRLLKASKRSCPYNDCNLYQLCRAYWT